MQKQSFIAIDPKLLKSEDRILLAAIKIFADCSPKLASIRMIAKEANVSYSAITYYFKTKENLYQEVIRRTISSLAQSYALPAMSLPETPLQDQESAKMELRAFLGRLIDFLYANPYAVSLAKIVLREHLAPSEIYEQLNTDVFKKVLDRMIYVVLSITEKKDRRQAALQFFSMVGQVIGFRIQRELLVRHLDFTGFSSIEIEELKTLIFKNIFCQLGVQP